MTNAQVRTVVASTGERLVVLPEADYEALVQAAQPKAIAPAAVAPKAVAPKEVVAQPSLQQQARAQASRAQAAGPLRPLAKAEVQPVAVPAQAESGSPESHSLEHVLLFG